MSAEDSRNVDADTTQRDEKDKAIAKVCMDKGAILVRSTIGMPRRGGEFELCNSFPMFNQYIEQQKERLYKILSETLKVAGSPVRLPKDATLNTYIDLMVTANDNIAERAGVLMDVLERAGRDEAVKVPKVIVGAESTKRAEGMKVLSTDVYSSIAERLRAAHEEKESIKSRNSTHVAKPQKEFGFGELIDNSNKPFSSKLVVKHNSRQQRDSGIKITDCDGEVSKWAVQFSEEDHPYRVELEHFVPPSHQMDSKECVKYKPIDETIATYVNTNEGLEKLVETLNNVKEFAMDVEHHSTRSYLGISCLIQISTRDTDYIIDPFPIWKEMHKLNEPCTNPNILKVLHGASSDVEWLQRDFGIYLVNMFDTYNAMQKLEFAKFSLAYLVQTFCNVTLNKQYQMSDWRVRPITPAQLQYAQSDTHYLLYCYDQLREDLLAKGNSMKNLLTSVYNDGRITCSKVYLKPDFDALGYEKLLGSRRRFNSQQVYALAELWKWRDQIARQEDESSAHVLPDHMMLHMAESLPRDVQGIYACCSPIPLLVKQYGLDIHRIIYAARDKPIEKSFAQDKASRGEEESILQSIIDKQNRMTHVKSVLRCNIDFTHSRFDEEVGVNKDFCNNGEVTVKPDSDTFLHFLSKDTNSVNQVLLDDAVRNTDTQKKVHTKLDAWASPFELYTLAIKEAAKREKELAAIKKDTPDTTAKKMYSHHDPVISRLPVVREQDLNEDNIDLADRSEGENDDEVNTRQTASKYTDDQILTKKALKRQRKINREGADMRTDLDLPLETNGSEDVEKPSYSKRIKNDQDEEEEKRNLEPVDYSQYDPSMFNQKKSRGDNTFDPFNQKFRLEKSKRNNQRRGRGGFNRMGTMSTGYKPEKK